MLDRLTKGVALHYTKGVADIIQNIGGLFSTASIEASVPTKPELAATLNNKLLTYQSVIGTGEKQILVPLLIDCGATKCFVQPTVAEASGAEIITTHATIQVHLANGSILKSTKVAKRVRIRIGEYVTCCDCTILDIGLPLILGKPWLTEANPLVN